MSTTTTAPDEADYCFLGFGDRCSTNTKWKFCFGWAGLLIGLTLLVKFCYSKQQQPSSPPADVEQGQGRPAAGRTVGGYTVEVFRKTSTVAVVECTICLRELEDGEERSIVTACRHFYHIACLDSWLANKKSCPLCRGPIGK